MEEERREKNLGSFVAALRREKRMDAERIGGAPACDG